MTAVRSTLALVPAALAALALPACGSSDAVTTPTTGTGASAEATIATNGRRAIRHALGTTELGGTPRRVVVLDTPALQLATELGVRPAGTVEPQLRERTAAGLPVQAQARGIPRVGTVQRPDVAAIADLEPDLILGDETQHAPLYDELSEIAPTVLTATAARWQENIRTDAAALGKLPQAEELLDDYARRARLAGGRARPTLPRS